MTKYRLLKLFFTIIVRLLAKIDVKGLEHIPQGIPFILAVNHLTILEPPVLFVILPVKRITVFVAKEWAMQPVIGWLLKAVDAICVNRQKIDRQALRAALAILKKGGIVGISPEGTRSRTGGLIRAKAGIAYLAIKANVPILPIGVSGQVGFMEKFKRFKQLHLRVNIGELIYLPPLSGVKRGEQLQKYADEIMIAIARLIDAELRGVYRAAVEAATTPEF